MIEIHADTIFIDDFLEACREEDINKVSSILQQKPSVIDLNYFDSKFETGLAVACKKRNLKLISLLLDDKRISLEYQTSSEKKHVLDSVISSTKKKLDVIKCFLDKNCYSLLENDKKWHKNTLFHLLTNGKDILDLALSYERIVNAIKQCRDEFIYRLSPLHIACIQKDYQLVKKLLKETENPNVEDDARITPLMFACMNGYKDIVRLFLKDKRVNLVAKDKFGKSGFVYACQHGHYSIVKILLKYQIVQEHINDVFPGTAFSISALNGHTNIVKYIMDHPNFIPDSPFYFDSRKKDDPIIASIRSNNPETLRILLEYSISSNFHPISEAALRGSPDMLQILHTHIKDFNGGDFGESSPLALAAGQANIENVKYLMTIPDMNPTFGGGFSWERNISPIFNAVYSGNTAIVTEMLKNEKVTKEFEDTIKSNDLLRACSTNNIELLQSILNHECDVNIKDKNGCAPLHIAACHRDRRMLLLLIQHPKINVNILNHNHRSPLICAIRNGTRANIEILLSHPDIRLSFSEKFEDSALYSASHCPHIMTLLLNHPSLDSSILEDKTSENGTIGDMIMFATPYPCIFEILSHPKFEDYSLNRALKIACEGGLGKSSKILKRLLDDERVEYTIDFCKHCLNRFSSDYSYRRKVNVAYTFCKKLEICPEEITKDKKLINDITRLFISNKNKSARY